MCSDPLFAPPRYPSPFNHKTIASATPSTLYSLLASITIVLYYVGDVALIKSNSQNDTVVIVNMYHYANLRYSAKQKCQHSIQAVNEIIRSSR